VKFAVKRGPAREKLRFAALSPSIGSTASSPSGFTRSSSSESTMMMDEPQEEVREETPEGKRARQKEELLARFRRGNLKLDYLNKGLTN